MYVSTCSSKSVSASILRAARFRFASTLYSPSSSISSSVSRSFVSPSSASKPSSFITYRSFNLSSAVRSLRCSVPRWSLGFDWRSPVSHRAQIRTAASVIKLFRHSQPITPEDPFKEMLTNLPKPGVGDIGKFHGLPALNDPRKRLN